MAEVHVWTVAIGTLPIYPPWHFWISRKKRQNGWNAISYIVRLEGFLGFVPVPNKGTLCIFKTENDAKIGRNLMDAVGINTGHNICDAYVDDQYLMDTSNRGDEI